VVNEFFLGFNDVIEEDLMRVIEESISSRRTLASFNATFIDLIPKYNNPSSFDEYMLISIGNCICNIITKIIARRVKRLLSKKISSE